MSDIYNFKIQSIEDRLLTINATIVHPDVDWVEDTWDIGDRYYQLQEKYRRTAEALVKQGKF